MDVKTGLYLSQLVLCEAITESEADKLQKELTGKKVAHDWREILEQLSQIIDRPIHDSVCEFCLGTGEVTEDGRDSDGNIERGVNTRKCLCQMGDGD